MVIVIAIVTANTLGIGIAEIPTRQLFGRTVITTEIGITTVARSLLTVSDQ